jgi:hypothetical protein
MISDLVSPVCSGAPPGSDRIGDAMCGVSSALLGPPEELGHREAPVCRPEGWLKILAGWGVTQGVHSFRAQGQSR